MFVVSALLVWVGSAAPARAGGFPRYDHVFLMMEENQPYGNIIKNPNAPIINALAEDYGLATNYHGTSDPSEPNYVAILGGSDFGITSDDPYYFPGQSFDAPSLMSELKHAGLTWKGYYQGMPYAGYRGFCFPAKCNGIPDADTQYVSKHNGVVNFTSEHTPTEYARQRPYGQLASDLASGNVANFSYIVPDECHDMHGAPPWCVDSDNPRTVSDNWLVATGDAFVGQTVNEITSSPVWKNGSNAIVITWDEGNFATDRVAAIVITNHGPRDLQVGTSFNHYSLTASFEDAFGLPCLANACTASPMTPLFSQSGRSTIPTLPPPHLPAPNGDNSVSATGAGVQGPPATLGGQGWQVVPSPNLTSVDNVLASVSARSATDAWAVGDYYPNVNDPAVLATLGEHWNGSTWTAYPLPNVGLNENALLSVSELRSGKAWAVGYYVDADYEQKALVEHYDGTDWSVTPLPQPGAQGNILYGVAAISDTNVWAVGGQRDAGAVWHPLIEHWDGTDWAVSSQPHPASADTNAKPSELLYAISAASGSDVYAAGQTGTAFPSSIFTEHWDGSSWTRSTGPVDSTESLVPLGLDATSNSLTIAGERESDKAPNTTLVASGPPPDVELRSTPSQGAGENDLFSVATAADGSSWAAGWYIDPSSGNHEPIIEHGVGPSWAIVSTPDLSADGGDNGFASIAAIPGGGLWAVGMQTNSQGNPATLIEYHP
jgi:hypothetical protein